MKKTYLYIILAGLILISIACEKVIEMDIEDTKIKIVANCLIEPDSIIEVNITRSRHILDNASILPLDDADVKLYEDGILIGTLTYDSRGNYYINHKPSHNKEYRLEVTHEDYDNVFAQTIVPSNVVINSIDTIKTFDDYGDEIYNVYIHFSDPEESENFYYIRSKVRYKYEEYDPNMVVYDTLYVGPDTTIVDIDYGGYRLIEREEYLYLDSDDIIIETYHPSGGGLIFSDELINGSNYTLKASFNKWSMWNDTNKIYIDLYSINRDYYNYVKSYVQNDYASEDPFAQPVNVYTNIENGIGIFGASSKASRDSITIILDYGGHGYVD